MLCVIDITDKSNEHTGLAVVTMALASSHTELGTHNSPYANDDVMCTPKFAINASPAALKTETAIFTYLHLFYVMGFLVRFEGKWHEVHPRPYEPDRMTTDIAWIQLKERVTAEEAYRRWFERQRKLSHLLQQ